MSISCNWVETLSTTPHLFSPFLWRSYANAVPSFNSFTLYIDLQGFFDRVKHETLYSLNWNDPVLLWKFVNISLIMCLIDISIWTKIISCLVNSWLHPVCFRARLLAFFLESSYLIYFSMTNFIWLVDSFHKPVFICKLSQQMPLIKPLFSFLKSYLFLLFKETRETKSPHFTCQKLTAYKYFLLFTTWNISLL